MIEPRTLVHIGVGKTGTTTLQQNLFARHKGILNIGRPYASDEFKGAIESLREDDEVEYRHAMLGRLCDEALAKARGRAVVLSDETLVHPISQSEIAERLSAILPDAHILITIRNQYDLIVSYWAGHGRILKNVPQPYRGKTVGFDDWFSFEAVAKRSFFTRLDFHRLYQIYAGAFGADRVHVMTFEELVVKPMAYAAALATLLGVDPDEMSKLIVTKPAKPRPSEVATKYRALRQRLLPNISLAQLPGGATVRRALHKFIETAPPLTVVLKPAQRDIICARFGPSNRLLAAATQIDLTALDYPMTPDPAPTRTETAFAVPAAGGRA